jgi:hypothetical protein
MTIIAMRLRNPAMATGFHETILMNNPPELHKMALKSKKRMALDLFSMVYLATRTGIGLRTLMSSSGAISHKRPFLPALMKILGRLRMVSSAYTRSFFFVPKGEMPPTI